MVAVWVHVRGFVENGVVLGGISGVSSKRLPAHVTVPPVLVYLD
jgi:hypothetical protein